MKSNLPVLFSGQKKPVTRQSGYLLVLEETRELTAPPQQPAAGEQVFDSPPCPRLTKLQ
jgi:hypothetical protein